jgi:hypothetical protein
VLAASIIRVMRTHRRDDGATPQKTVFLVHLKVYKAIILPVTLYGYENLPFSLREEHRLTVFENIQALRQWN